MSGTGNRTAMRTRTPASWPGPWWILSFEELQQTPHDPPAPPTSHSAERASREATRRADTAYRWRAWLAMLRRTRCWARFWPVPPAHDLPRLAALLRAARSVHGVTTVVRSSRPG